jgi:glycosyltransferase involved in cell wall biosynthesis
VILLNARAAARPELGGVERWARELAARLPKVGPYEVIRPPTALSHRAGHAWEQAALPLKARKAELLLNPANLAPIAFPRNVVVIHDAAALRRPEWYSPPYAAWQHRVLPLVARRARLVITVSEFSRREVHELLGVDAKVVPGGVDPRFRPDADPAPARAALALAEPYVLTVASQTARKNISSLAATARRLQTHGIELVAAGGGRPQFRHDGAPGVRALGHVPDDHLPGLYAGARAFGALPETCGDAARYADPSDHEDIAEQVQQAIDDDALRAAGPQRASRFTWDRTVRELDALIRS